MQILAVVQGDPDGERVDLKALAPMVLANWGQPIKEAMNDPAQRRPRSTSTTASSWMTRW